MSFQLKYCLATGFCASVVARLSVDPGHDWAVGEELLLFSSSRSVGCGLEGSDPPKSTSSSIFPVWSGGGDRTALAARFSTLLDLGSLIGGPGCCCVACPVSTDLLSSVQVQSDYSVLLQVVGILLHGGHALSMTATASEL